MRVVMITVAALVGALVAPVAAFASGTSYAWVGGVSGAWTDAGNWSPVGVPSTGDSAVVDPPFDARCNTHITGVPDGLELVNLTVDEHAFNGNPDSACLTSIAGGSITVDGQFAFHAGTISSPLTLAATATGTITPNIVHDDPVLAGPVSVLGTLSLINATGVEGLSLTGSPGITVAPGATLSTQGDNDVSSDCCLDNAHVVNHGTISLGAGTLDVFGVELDQDAALVAPAGATLVTSLAPQTAGPGATWAGAGTWNMHYGQITASGTQTLSDGFHWVLGGHGTTSEEYLHGTASLAGSGSFEWAGGEIQSTLTLGRKITAFASGPDGVDRRYLDGRDPDTNTDTTLTAHGKLSFTGGAGFSGSNNGRLTLTASGVLRLDPSTTLSGDYTITNKGGTVSVLAARSGAAPVIVGGSYRATGGTLAIGQKATVQLYGSAGALSGTTISGAGTLQVASAMTVSGTSTVGAGTTVALQYPGTFTGTDGSALTGPGTFAWIGGGIIGALSVTTGAQSLSGTATKHVYVPTGTRHSSVTFGGPTTIAAGTSSDADVLQTDTGGAVTFAGSLSIGANVDVFGGAITMSGTTTVAGEVDLESGATLTNNGSLTVASGVLFSDAGVSQTAGTTTVASGATLKVGSGSSLRLQSGTLAGTGSVVGDVSNVAGVVAPGGSDAGTLTVTGDYKSSSGATLSMDIASGTSDKLAVGGTATLAGTVIGDDLDGYVPTTGTDVTIVTAAVVPKPKVCVQTTGAGLGTQYWKLVLGGTTSAILRSAAGSAPAC